ncbi:NAD(P)-dependent alcohol dehydrogenase [Streptomyces daliensis]
MRIQAALVESPGGPFTVRDVDLAPPRADEILVRMTATGICHTDLSTRGVWPRQRMPMVFGHEGAGVVEEVGREVTSVAPGDAVCLSFRSCGACEMCAEDHPAYCLRGTALNSSGGRGDGTTPLSRDGTPVFGGYFGQSSFATHALAHESNTVRLPAGLPPVLAAPLGCGVQTGVGTVLNVLSPTADSHLAIFGAGAVGLSALMAAVASGCQVVIVEPVTARRALAEELGAKAAIAPSEAEDTVAAIRDLTGGGAHHALDTTGRPDVIGQAVAGLRRRGALALVGMGAKLSLDIMTLMGKGISLHGALEGDAVPTEFIPRLIRLHRQGDLPVDRLVTTFPFAEIESAARAAASGEVIKPVLTFP